MNRPGNGAPEYEVYCSRAMAKAIKQLHRKATSERRGPSMLAAFRQAVESLQQNPINLGEPLYRLPALRLQVRTLVIRPIAIDYAICTDRPLVFVKGVKLLSQ